MMRTRWLRASILVLGLIPAAAWADEPPPSSSDRRMRSEDRWVLVAAVVGSVASIGVGGFVHWKLMRGGDEK